jgi:hypothetical protein
MRGEAALSGAPATDDPGEWRPAIVYQERLCLPPSKRANMSKINKLSVEKALDKLRAGDAKRSKDTLLGDKIDALDEEIERMRTQRLRLEHLQRKRDKGNR